MKKSNSNFIFKNILSKRVIAFLIDLSLVKYINQGFTLSWEAFLKSFFILPPEIVQKIDQLSKSLSLLTLPLIFLSYFTITLFLGDGKTFGKALCRIKIKEVNGSAPNFTNCLFRSFAYCLCFFIGPFLFLIPFFTKDGKGIQDWVSNTVVAENIELKKENKDKEKEKQLELFERERAA